MRRRGTLVGCRLTAFTWGRGLEVEAPRMWFWELKMESGTQSKNLEPRKGVWKPAWESRIQDRSLKPRKGSLEPKTGSLEPRMGVWDLGWES